MSKLYHEVIGHPMRILRFTLYCSLLLSAPVYAGPIAERLGIDVEEPAKKPKWQNFLKKGAESALKYIPGGELVSSLLDSVTGGGLEKKVDRIEEKQNTSLDQLQQLARKALDTKRKVEEMYYFKKQSQQRAEELAHGLKQSKLRNLLGVLVEDTLGFPINPAEYLPDIPTTRALKKNLENDMSLERDFIQRGRYLLQDTRAALAEQELDHQTPGQFTKAYQQAEDYEAQVLQALHAKRQATLKLYQEEIKRLEKEVALLEKAKEKKGLTVSDVMQIEQTIEMKRGVVRELHEKITQGTEQAMEPTEAQKEALLQKKMTSDAGALAAYFTKERQRIRQKYGHLWKFW